MSSSVINGANGKSPLIDKMNQLAVKEVTMKEEALIEQLVCGKGKVNYPSVPVSFSECRKAIEKKMMELRKERVDGKTDV